MEDHTRDTLDYIDNIENKFEMLIDHLRNDVERVEDLRIKALFEVSAEVITGLKKAFTDYKLKNEPAWQ